MQRLDLRNQAKMNLISAYATYEYSDRLFGLWVLNPGKVLRIKNLVLSLTKL